MNFKEITVRIGGMSCAMCVKAVENSIKSLGGIIDVTINLSTGKARIVFDPRFVSIHDIEEAVERSGYKFIGVEEELSEQLKKRLVVAAVAGAILLTLKITKIDISWIGLILATPVVIYSGKDIFLAAFNALRHRMLNMDVMYSMGVGSSYIASVGSTFGFFRRTISFMKPRFCCSTFLF